MVTLRGARHAVVVGLLIAATATGSAAVADSRGGSGQSSTLLNVKLTGYEEDPLALSTTGAGRFRAQVDDKKQEITYRLSYAALEGPVLQAHIHFGGKAQSGGISAFLCSNLGNGPAGTPACPPAPGVVDGVIRPAGVVGPAGQGIAAGEFAELVAAIRAGTAYANVHSEKYPGGEIRGQLGHHH
jgi:CHRD domain-containing protein